MKTLEERLASIDVQEALEETFFELHGSDDPHDIRLCNHIQNTATHWINFLSTPAERKRHWETRRRQAIELHESLAKGGPTLPDLPPVP